MPQQNEKFLFEQSRNFLLTAVRLERWNESRRHVNTSNPFVNAVAGGWQVGGSWTIQSGLPENITIGGVDRSNTGVGYDRPNATGIGQYAADPTPSRWLNPDAFVEAPAG